MLKSWMAPPSLSIFLSLSHLNGVFSVPFSAELGACRRWFRLCYFVWTLWASEGMDGWRESNISLCYVATLKVWSIWDCVKLLSWNSEASVLTLKTLRIIFYVNLSWLNHSFMELQSGLPGPLSPGALSPTLDYSTNASPGFSGPGPSHGNPVRAPSPSLSGQAVFNYNQLEGRFKQLQGKRRSPFQITPPSPQPRLGPMWESQEVQIHSQGSFNQIWMRQQLRTSQRSSWWLW